jgi:hypothetical protein
MSSCWVGNILALTVMSVLWLVMIIALGVFYTVVSPILLARVVYSYIKSRRNPVF